MFNKSEMGLLKGRDIIKTDAMKYKHFQRIRRFLDTRLLNIEGVFLAGAALQTVVCPTDVIYDYDVFFTDKDAIAHAEAVLKQEGFTEDTLFDFIDPKMKTYYRADMKVQLIYATIYDKVEDCMDSFDFTCTMFAFDGQDFYYTGESMIDTQRKELYINKLKYPRNTLERVKKYTEIKGYEVSAGTMKKIISAVELDEGESYFYEGDERDQELLVKINSQRMRSADLITVWERL